MAIFNSVPCVIYGYHANGLITIKSGDRIRLVSQKDITIEMVECAQ